MNVRAYVASNYKSCKYQYMCMQSLNSESTGELRCAPKLEPDIRIELQI